MRRSHSDLVILCLFFNVALIGAPKKAIDYVDPFLGTSSSRWMLYPGPSMPFGMVKLSPDNVDTWGMDAGYEHSIESIAGFGFIHSWAMGSFLSMPTIGPVHIQPGPNDDPDAGYRSRFRHAQEEASPGYYSVLLDDYQIKAELTTTTRAGIQRYTFPPTDNARILFDLHIPEEDHPTLIEAGITKVNDQEISGQVRRQTGWNDYTIHFVTQFSRPFRTFSGWKGSDILRDTSKVSAADNQDIGAWLDFSTTEDRVVVLKTGVSFVSIEQARLNLELETKNFGWDFDLARDRAAQTWNDLLGRIRVEGGSETDKIKFYTNMYRAYCARTIFSDVNGQYRDMCENRQELPNPDSPIYGCDAFWNTFWNLNSLWSLVTPDITNQWVNSLLEIYDRGGWLAKGPGGIEYSSIMVASHEIALIVGAYQKGIRDYDVNRAYQAIREIQMNPGRPHECGGYVGNRNLETYMRTGYVPADEGPVSNTLEYAYDDWCVAQMARSLDKMEDYAYFLQRAQNYRNVYDPDTGFARPKHAGGPWLQDFVPIVGAVGKEDNFGSRDYVEGNAWQFTWFVPHDVQGLINLMGRDGFNKRLSKGFARSGNFASEFVNHSNQPNMQAPWLFNYAGKPWLTQKWVREILDKYYGTGPVDGYPGDEDQGQMGAWYVMSAMGLFQMDGGAAMRPVYELSGPIFEEITIQLDGDYYAGQTFIIRAPNVTAENRYIQAARLNGRPLDTFWFHHADLVKGGTLELDMGPKPNHQWASNGRLPHTYDLNPIVTTPYVTTDKRLFLDFTEVAMACDTQGARIHYTLDASPPTLSSPRYQDPLSIDRTCTLKMRGFVGERASLTATAFLEKADMRQPIDPGRVTPGLRYDYYTGMFRRVQDFRKMQPAQSGTALDFSIETRDREQYFGFAFQGLIKVPTDGLYSFFLASNDGACFSLDQRTLIDHDGLHPVSEKARTIALKAGMHPISVEYFQEGGTHHLQVRWKGPGFDKQDVPASALFHAAEYSTSTPYPNLND
jgi:predicted alpha-1,2-mannosidase